MSVFKSWLPHRPLRTNYELPMWTQDLNSSIMPPAPIIQSRSYTPTRRRDSSPASSRLESASEDILVLRHKEEELQHTLQELLDAQAEGLLAGLGNAPDDQMSTGSTTPTMSSLRTRSLSPAQRFRKPKVGLKGARKAIWKSILECADLKAEEDRLLTKDMIENKRVIKQISSWDKKQEGLHKEIDRIEHEDTEARLKSLRGEASRMEREIMDMEIRLVQMKSRHRKLLTDISDLQNNVQSELASYQESLKLLDSNVQKFLWQPPVRHGSQSDQSSFTSLPPKRRTLAMAKDHWEADMKAMELHRKVLRKEHAALEDGAIVWKEVVAEIITFEKDLRSEMHKTTILGPEQAHNDLENVLGQMGGLITSIAAKHETAETKGWKLLVVCIGAELEALKQGKEILESTLSRDDASSTRTDELEEQQGSEKSAETSETGEAIQGETSTKNRHPYDSGDDEPDPDFMVSKSPVRY